MILSVVFASFAIVVAISAAPVEYEAAASEYGGYGGRQVIILDDSNGYGNNGYQQKNYGGGGYGGYGYDPIVVHIPNSQPYYPEHVPLYGNYYGPPAHVPHKEYGYGY